MRIINSTNSINFNAGKVHLFSDFDGTYCPIRHSDLHNIKTSVEMNNYCAKMDKFFKSTQGDVHFHITTGRTFGEYEVVSYLLKKKNMRLPLPESFFAKNGSDEYIKKGTDNNFYENGVFPFEYKNTNSAKEEKIKKMTNWDGMQLKSFIKNLAEKYNLRIVEADSEHSIKDYGENSLFSKGKLNQNEWKKLPFKNGKIRKHEEPIADFVIGSRKDGNLKFNLIFPPDYDYCPERNFKYDSFIGEIEQFLSDKKINYDMQWTRSNKRNHYRNHCNIVPNIENKGLTKLFDTKEALKKAIKNNDIIIVAGDSSNDFEMLNPLEYFEQSDWNKFKSNSKHQDFYNGSMYKKLSDLNDVYEGKNPILQQELESNGFLNKIKNLPLYGIIIKKDDSKLEILSDVFKNTGKIIEVQNGELDKGITNIIENHSAKNDKFKKAMSAKFKTFIFGTSEQKRSNKTGIIIGSIIILTTIASAICYFRNKKSTNAK